MAEKPKPEPKTKAGKGIEANRKFVENAKKEAKKKVDDAAAERRSRESGSS